jgi:hypothetical protein
VEVNPLTKGELKWSQYKKVPVVVLDGEQLNDSSAIISRLAAEIEAGAPSGARPHAGSSAPPPAGKGWLGGWLGGSKGGGGGGGSAAGVGASQAEEEKWRRWVDDWFVRVRALGGGAACRVGLGCPADARLAGVQCSVDCLQQPAEFVSASTPPDPHSPPPPPRLPAAPGHHRQHLPQHAGVVPDL